MHAASMEAKHLATLGLRTSFHSRVPSAVAVCRSSTVVASRGGSGGKEVWLWWDVFNATTEPPLRLSGHQEELTALAFSNSDPTHLPQPQPILLCSVSSDTVLLWELDHTHTTEDPLAVGLTAPLATNGGRVSCVAFSPDNHYIAVCQGNMVLVFVSESLELDTTLLGHSAPVTCAAFPPHLLAVITASEDRTFKVWNLEQSSLVYQSPIVSSSPFLSMATDPRGATMAIGTADGKLRVYDLSPGYRCLQECDIGGELEERWTEDTEASSGVRVVQSAAPWRQQPTSHDCHVTEAMPITSVVEASPAILAIRYWYGEGDNSYQCEVEEEKPLGRHTREVLREPPSLLVVTHTGLLRLNANTLETSDALHFREPLVSIAEEGSLYRVPTVATCDFVYNPIDRELYCALGSMFHGSLSVLSLRLKQEETDSEAADRRAVISVLSSTPLAPNSPLRAELTLKTPSAATGGSVRKKQLSGGTRGRSVADKPLTFRSKVKSSGYSEAPRTKMFTPKTSTPTQKPGSYKKAPGIRREESYPVTCKPPTHLYHSAKLCDRPAPINSASFTGGGQYLSCTSDRAAYVLRMPPHSGRTHAFVGHDGNIYTSCWSQDGQWLLTASADHTARVWSTGLADPILTLSTSQHNFRTQGGEGQANPPFLKEVTDAQFYYLDKFILLSCGNSLHLYKYYIDTARPDDIRRYQTNSRYKLVKSFPLQSAQTITAMSCVNEFHSYIVLAAGSNKSLEIFDMNVGQSLRTVEGVHCRPVTCIAQSKGSRFASHPPSAYDLFLTSAVTDGVKLWDLRSNRCVSRFSSHYSRSVPVSATFSPCARYIATGSEDRAAYIYSLSSPSPLHRLTGHSDVVTTVTYHPLKAKLATCTADGQVNFFSEETIR